MITEATHDNGDDVEQLVVSARIADDSSIMPHEGSDGVVGSVDQVHKLEVVHELLARNLATGKVSFGAERGRSRLTRVR